MARNRLRNLQCPIRICILNAVNVVQRLMFSIFYSVYWMPAVPVTLIAETMKWTRKIEIKPSKLFKYWPISIWTLLCFGNIRPLLLLLSFRRTERLIAQPFDERTPFSRASLISPQINAGWCKSISLSKLYLLLGWVLHWPSPDREMQVEPGRTVQRGLCTNAEFWSSNADVKRR